VSGTLLPPHGKGALKGALELVGLTKQYGDERVVDAVDAKIRPGEFFSLLGPSGSGKTTTLMMIAGFVSPDGGAIRLDGADLIHVPPQRRGLGMVFQNYAIFPHLNVFENVAFPLRARRVPNAELRRRVAATLELVRLERFATRYARELSGGQQQRVAIARAIVFQPSIVLMDEPLGALDKNLRYDMQVEIKEIQQRLGMTVVYVTHDQEEAMNMSDRIAIMNQGRIAQLGPPGEIYERPSNAFVGRFLGEANLLEGTIEQIAGDEAALRTRDGILLRARCASSAGAQRAASLFVRPEKLTFGDIPETNRLESNHVEGVVQRRSFLGSMIRTTVQVGPTTRLTVDHPNLADGGGPQVGATVVVSWAVAHTLILPE
jgi:spermidine/putrescine ABC transporter ATP-binding subunit